MARPLARPLSRVFMLYPFRVFCFFCFFLGVASASPPFMILRDFLVDSVRVMFRLRVSFSSSFFLLFLQTFKAYLRADREK